VFNIDHEEKGIGRAQLKIMVFSTLQSLLTLEGGWPEDMHMYSSAQTTAGSVTNSTLNLLSRGDSGLANSGGGAGAAGGTSGTAAAGAGGGSNAAGTLSSSASGNALLETRDSPPPISLSSSHTPHPHSPSPTLHALPLCALTDTSVRPLTDLIVDDAFDRFFGREIQYMSYEMFVSWVEFRPFLVDAVFHSPLAHIMPPKVPDCTRVVYVCRHYC
jgi:hypothetical protein